MCTDELPSAPHQAPSCTSPVSNPQMQESTFAPVVISIMPIPAGQSCLSLVSPSAPVPKMACAGLDCRLDTGSWSLHLPEGMVVVWMRAPAVELERADGVETGFRGRTSGT